MELAYNALGLPVTETADGETITRTYDKTGQILSLQSTLGANLEYKRNEFGELTEFQPETAVETVKDSGSRSTATTRWA